MEKIIKNAGLLLFITIFIGWLLTSCDHQCEEVQFYRAQNSIYRANQNVMEYNYKALELEKSRWFERWRRCNNECVRKLIFIKK